MKLRTRRAFLTQTAVGPLLSCHLVEGGAESLVAQSQPSPRYDLLVKGGQVIDPSQGLSAERDVAILGSKIARIAENIPEGEARHVLDARGKIVTPGLIDVHVHVYDAVTALGVPADPNCIAKGVTTVVDAGSSGADTFPGLRKYVIDKVDTRVYALLNISVFGLAARQELLELRYLDVQRAVRRIEEHRDVILGIKIRLSANITGDHDLKALGLAREAADAVGLPLMVHIGDPYSPPSAILPSLKKGDVITHSFRGDLLDRRGRILPEVRKAVERGVNLNVGHGAGGFSFRTVEKFREQDILPGTISSDLHQGNVNGPVFDLATTLSKFLLVGLTLDQIIERSTTNPARVFGFPQGLGTLHEGAAADVSVFSLEEGSFEFVDTRQDNRRGTRKLVPFGTVKAGRVYSSGSGSGSG